GPSATCTHPAGNPGAVCHTATSECDLTDTCTGTSTTCPIAVKAAGTACTDDGNPCTADTCNGSTSAPACTHPAGNAGTVCRAAVNECDDGESVAEGSSICPTDGGKAGGTACTEDGNPCTTDTG